MTKNKYKTFLIDEVSYLKIKGFRYTSKRFANRASEWIFDDTPELRKELNKFWSGSTIMINLNKWLFVRQQVKFEQDSLPIRIRKEKDMMQNGQRYFFIADNGGVTSALYGDNPIHQERFNKGNMFVTKELAERNKNL